MIISMIISVFTNIASKVRRLVQNLLDCDIIKTKTKDTYNIQAYKFLLELCQDYQLFELLQIYWQFFL